VMADEASPEQLAMDARLSEEMKAAIDSLPEQFRTTLWLCEVEGLSYEEAAQLMKVPLGTVRSRLSRARNMMREKLEASKTYAK
jgi:RNA polymerase sigma-70 factor (ECF subfamily)